jgi:hypothetical protein
MSKKNLLSLIALAGLAPLALAQTGAGTELVLTTNDAQQQIEIIADIGGVQVIGIDGVADALVPDVTRVRLTTGTALDTITITIRTPNAPEFVIDTRGGDSDVRFVYEIDQVPGAATSAVTVVAGNGNDKFAVEGTTLAESFAANWNVRLGAGNNETTLSLSNPTPSLSNSILLQTLTLGGMDKLSVNIVSAALDHRFDVRGNLGEGNDEAVLVYDGIAASSTNVNFAFGLGGGNDVSEALFVSRGGEVNITGNYAGGNGNDNLKFDVEGDGVINATMSGGAGSDYLDMALKGTITGTPRLLGEAGNDFLKIVVDGPRLVTPLLDGGLGFDEAIGFGTFANIERIN